MRSSVSAPPARRRSVAADHPATDRWNRPPDGRRIPREPEMPDPTPAAYRLYSTLRQRPLAGTTTAARRGPAPASSLLVFPVTLRINDARVVPVPLHLYGPGDVTGLDAREVIRTEPQRFMTDFEPNYFPLIEFDRPD